MAISKSVKRLIILASSLAVFGAVVATVGVLIHKEQKDIVDSITLNIDSIDTKTLSYEALTFNPGDSKKYTINFKSNVTNTYTVSLDFDLVTDNGLAQYIDVDISYNDFSFNGNLKNLFNSEETIDFDCTVNKSKKEKVNIIYSMPSSVGNEAQNLFVNFDIVLNIEQK